MKTTYKNYVPLHHAKTKKIAAILSEACQTCGACCVFSHTWPELGEEDPDGDGIPLELVDCETGRMKCDGDRCLALEGVVGKKVRCTVYAHRPKVCREFSPQNRPHDCNTVRAHSGLPPLPPLTNKKVEAPK
jgi:Fe-S-cluster containining protein